jgi:hypothetical protein
VESVPEEERVWIETVEGAMLELLTYYNTPFLEHAKAIKLNSRLANNANLVLSHEELMRSETNSDGDYMSMNNYTIRK